MYFQHNKTNEDILKCKYLVVFFSSVFLDGNTITMKMCYEKQKYEVKIDEEKSEQ